MTGGVTDSMSGQIIYRLMDRTGLVVGGGTWSGRGIHTGVAVRVMLINLTAISTGFWKEGWGEGGRKDRLGLRSDDGNQVSMDLLIHCSKGVI